MQRSLLMAIVLVGLFGNLPVQAADYTLSISTSAAEETVVEKRYKRTCLDRVSIGQAALPNCAADCATCTPTAGNKQTLMEGWVDNRLKSDVAQMKQQKADQARLRYYQGTAQQQADTDAVLSIPDQDL